MKGTLSFLLRVLVPVLVSRRSRGLAGWPAHTRGYTSFPRRWALATADLICLTWYDGVYSGPQGRRSRRQDRVDVGFLVSTHGDQESRLPGANIISMQAVLPWACYGAEHSWDLTHLLGDGGLAETHPGAGQTSGALAFRWPCVLGLDHAFACAAPGSG